MVEYDAQVLRRLQLTQLEIYRGFVAFCESSGLNHALAYGSLLGAVRHSGFIPWDDDMDVIMPREDYDRFIKLAEKELPEDYEILSIEQTAGYVLPFAKMCKRGTTFIESSDEDRTYHSGIFIDIFPLDSTSANPKIRRKQIRKTFLLARMIVLTEYTYPKLPEGVSGLFATMLKMGCAATHILLKILGIHKRILYKHYHRIATQYKGEPWCIDITDYRAIYNTHPQKVFFPTGELMFEGALSRVLHDPNTYLTKYYGADYMMLPPIEKRRNHAASVIHFGD